MKKLLILPLLVFGSFFISSTALAIDLQPDNDTNLNGSWVSKYYFGVSSPTFNQMYWYEDDNITSNASTLSRSLQIFDGTATTSVDAITTGGGYTRNGNLIVACVSTGGATSTIPAFTGHVRILGNSYTVGAYNTIYGNTANGEHSLGLSYNTNCAQGSIFAENTRIATTSPANQATVATSTPFSVGATGYVNADDFDTDLKLRIKITYNGSLIGNAGIVAGLNSACFTASFGNLGFLCSQLLGLDLTSVTQDFPITASGYFDISTTTSVLTGGQYTMNTSIIKPYFTVLGFEIGTDTLVSYESSFIAGATSIYDDFVENVDDFLNDSYSNFDASSCNVVSGSFNLGTCVVGLILPSGNTFAIYGQLPDLLMTRFPFSYVSGIAYTWNSLEDGTTAPPSLAFNFADLGIGSTNPMGNILPNVTVFSSSTIGTYLSGSILTAFKALVSLALIIALFTNIFFRVRSIFDKT